MLRDLSKLVYKFMLHAKDIISCRITTNIKDIN